LPAPAAARTPSVIVEGAPAPTLRSILGHEPTPASAPPPVPVAAAAPASSAARSEASGSHPAVARLGDSSEWSQADMKRFFAAGESAPRAADEDSLGDFEAPADRARRARRRLIGTVVAVLLLGGAGTGGFYLWTRTRSPLKPSERLAARHGADGEGAGSESKPTAKGKKKKGHADEAASAGDEAKHAPASAPSASTASAGDTARSGDALTHGRSAGPEAPPTSAGTSLAAGAGAAAGAHTAATSASPSAAPTPLPPDKRAEYDAFVEKGNKQLAAGAFGAASKTFKAALAIDPDGAAAHAGVGWAAIENGATAMAEAEAKRAIALDPSIASSYRTVALVYHERGKKADACANYKLYLEKGATGPLATETRENMRDLGCK
jgi:Flp pilus assembly protein TadD